jgi:tRNA 2-thiouridine synthesizing protein E
MPTLTVKGKTYEVDEFGYLLDHREWTEDFAMHLASDFGIPGGLTEKHWQVIRFLRSALEVHGRCPLVYQTCRMNGLRLRDLKALFPSGYWRGACKLAGLNDREGYLSHQSYLPLEEGAQVQAPPDKVYRVDVRGFLVDPAEWDEDFAAHKAFEMKMPAALSARHWEILRFLRERFASSGKVPTVFETSEAKGIEIDELASLFPDGYQRGAVKLAGLKAK